MFDFNFWEILVLAAFAVIIFGPEKLPELARKAARVLNYLRNIANDAQGRLREELGPEFADLELADLNPRALVNKHLLNPVQEELAPLKSELEPLRGELEPVKAMMESGGSSPPNPAPEPVRPAVAFDTEAT
nr:sec-independent translocase [Propionicimonas sp.]